MFYRPSYLPMNSENNQQIKRSKLSLIAGLVFFLILNCLIQVWHICKMRSSLSSVSYLKRRGFQRSCCHDVSAPRGVLEHQIPPRAASVRPAGEHRTFFFRNAPALPIPSAFQMTFRILESVTDSRGDRPGLRTHQPVRAARGDRNIPCHLHSYHHPLPPSLSPSTPPCCPPAPWRGRTPVCTSSVLSSPSVFPPSPSLSLFSFFTIPPLLIWTQWPNWLFLS